MIWIDKIEINPLFKLKALEYPINKNSLDIVDKGHQYIAYKEMIDSESYIADVIRSYLYQTNIPDFLKEAINKSSMLSITRLKQYEFMEEHLDEENDDRDLQYVSLLYITETDDYKGRELYIKYNNETKLIKPLNGTVVIFDASLWHGVAPLIDNVNITSFSFGITKKDLM